MSGAPIVLTGFGPFPGVQTNPTATLAQDFHDQQIGTSTVIGQHLEVDFETIEGQIQEVFLRHSPKAIVLLGVAVQRSLIGLEGQAYNCREGQRPDATGRSFERDESLRGEMAIEAPLASDVHRVPLLQALLKADFPSELSDDPGRYLCNASFFHALSEASLRSPIPRCLFVHLPQVGNPMGQHPGRHWSLESLRQATKLILCGIENERMLPFTA